MVKITIPQMVLLHESLVNNDAKLAKKLFASYIKTCTQNENVLYKLNNHKI